MALVKKTIQAASGIVTWETCGLLVESRNFHVEIVLTVIKTDKEQEGSRWKTT